jgi:predicted transcriptional regulator
MSVHPDYAEAIVAGTKTVEFRRRVPELSIGTRLWIYATQPIGAVVGFATIENVTRAHPKTIWQKHQIGAGVDDTFFRAYFDDCREAVAILLASARRVGPITIEQLRGVRHAFHPPQVLTRLTAAEAAALRNLSG